MGLNEEYFIPETAESSLPGLEDIRRWFSNIRRELDVSSLQECECRMLADYYQDAGLLTNWRQPFFFHHYARPLHTAIAELFANGSRPLILDLGCGMGTQSILFALLGATVVGIDMDERALDVLEKRKFMYEQVAARTLDIRTVSGNVFELDLAAVGMFDGVYSLFAFNMMQPSEQLLKRICAALSDNAVVVIQDGNRKHLFNRLFRRRPVASRDELRAMFERNGLGDIRQTGTCAAPPTAWRIFPPGLLHLIDSYACSSEALAISYLHVARRTGDVAFHRTVVE